MKTIFPLAYAYKGHVNYLGDLDGIQASYGDVYSVTYMGHHYDPVELRKRIDANVLYCDGWQIMNDFDMEDIEYCILAINKEDNHVSYNNFETDVVVVKVKINHTEGSVKVIELWPSVLDIPEKRIEVLSDVLMDLRENKNVVYYKDDISADMEFIKVISDIKIIKNMVPY